MRHSKAYIAIVMAVFIGVAIVFAFFPRPAYSELEKRDLATFPEFSWQALADGSFTEGISRWFSDSEPFRDELLAVSMWLDKIMEFDPSGDNITFYAGDSGFDDDEDIDSLESSDFMDDMEAAEATSYVDTLTANANAKIANAGIIIVGEGENLRALMAFGGSAKGGVAYAEAANKYKEVFGDSVNVYLMAVPLAIEFYCPEKARKITRPQKPVIDNIHSHLNPGVKAVDVYSALEAHATEPIYLRTDHHWSPLGAFYAARAFAEVAGVSFPGLEAYEKRVVKGYVGSMYGYSGDIAVKQSPEDFIYYVPRNVEYTTTYIDYLTDQNYRVVGQTRPYQSAFFKHYPDGHGGAYCTFMGGDIKITVVRTSSPSRRRLLILKDSYGNALPGYMFYSFEEVHVVDTRYFKRNIIQYVGQNGITDILFANNIFNSYSSKYSKRYAAFLTQPDQTLPSIVPKEPAPADTIPATGPDSATGPAERIPREEPQQSSAPADSLQAVSRDSIRNDTIIK